MDIRSGLLAMAVIALAGCAPAHVPVEIRSAPEVDPQVEEVQADFARYEGVNVRWGGRIASVYNKEEETWIEVVATRLDGTGRPRVVDYAYGRFIARFDGFLDPQIYAMNRELTVYGKLEKLVDRTIGEHPYSYPLVRVQSHELWREYPERRYYSPPHPYYYHPYSYRFYRPYYPYFW